MVIGIGSIDFSIVLELYLADLCVMINFNTDINQQDMSLMPLYYGGI